MARILVAEDELAINDLICRNLRLVGHDATGVADGVQALRILGEQTFDLALLDVMMPGLSGFEVLQRVSASVPAIFVTAKEDLGSRLRGLSMGADDYVVKPFEILELLARVEAVLRRTNASQRAFELLGVRVDFAERRVTRDGAEVELTPREFDLLEALVTNRNLALTRAKLLELAWGFDYEGESRTVDMHVLRLRKKLGWEDAIQTVFKVGYRLNTRVAASSGGEGAAAGGAEALSRTADVGDALPQAAAGMAAPRAEGGGHAR